MQILQKSYILDVFNSLLYVLKLVYHPHHSINLFLLRSPIDCFATVRSQLSSLLDLSAVTLFTGLWEQHLYYLTHSPLTMSSLLVPLSRPCNSVKTPGLSPWPSFFLNIYTHPLHIVIHLLITQILPAQLFHLNSRFIWNILLDILFSLQCLRKISFLTCAKLNWWFP